MGDTVESFRLFPLGLVLLPREKLPLHIFEERYRTMIGECLEDELEFGVLWMSDDGLREVGCTARIEQVLEQFDDGRVNILVEGSRPFRMLRRIETLPYPAGDVELLDDADEKDTPAAAAEARVRYGDLVERVTRLSRGHDISHTTRVRESVRIRLARCRTRIRMRDAPRAVAAPVDVRPWATFGECPTTRCALLTIRHGRPSPRWSSAITVSSAAAGAWECTPNPMRVTRRRSASISTTV